MLSLLNLLLNMKRFGIKLFNIFISLISTSKVKKLLWSSLDSVMRKPTQELMVELVMKNTAGSNRQNFNKPNIIDVGANHGRLSNFYLSIFPGAKVYAVEPIKEFFDKIDDTHLKKFNLALSNKKTNLTLYQSGRGSKPFPKNTKGKKTGSFTVRALPGDDFVKEFNLNKVDIIKIDTEGLSQFYKDSKKSLRKKSHLFNLN